MSSSPGPQEEEDVQVWHGLDEVPRDLDGSVVTIGVFDGVHRGHRAVVGRAVERARVLGVPAVVVTFEPHPVAVLRPDGAPPRVSTLGHRLALLDGIGVDAVLVLPFDRERAAQSAEDFVTDVLVGALHARAVVVGEDFRFGHRASGDLDLLAGVGAEHGLDAEGVSPVGDGERWSSTLVRRHVLAGDVTAAAQVLGRPPRVEGEVVHGDHRGREIGYPTANLDVADGDLVPADGVYAGWLVRADGDRLPTAISIGTNPTFDGVTRRVEGYVLDRTDLDLYGERVALDVVERLRDTLRFDSVEALVEQMRADVDRARELLRAG